MGAIEHLTIALSAERAEKVRARVAAGDFRDESAVVEQALAALEAMDVEFGRVLPELIDSDVEQWLRAEVSAACDELDRDPSSGIPVDRLVAKLRAERVARGE